MHFIPYHFKGALLYVVVSDATGCGSSPSLIAEGRAVLACSPQGSGLAWRLCHNLPQKRPVLLHVHCSEDAFFYLVHCVICAGPYSVHSPGTRLCCVCGVFVATTLKSLNPHSLLILTPHPHPSLSPHTPHPSLFTPPHSVIAPSLTPPINDH